VAQSALAGEVSRAVDFNGLPVPTVKGFWQLKPMQSPRRVQTVDVGVKGVVILALAVECPGKHNWAHAIWVEPRLIPSQP